jgi:hexosaminidase
VVGGEASLWGEEIDSSNLVQRAWPRGCAFGERMWSARDVKSAQEAAPRLARQICRMKADGVAAAPIGPGSCFDTKPRQ